MFAAICLYAPLALAAWPANASCCDGNHCAVPAHPHRGASHRTLAESGHGMECEQGTAGMTSCSMQCCQQQECAPIASVSYVMPPPVFLSVPVGGASNFFAFQPNEFSRSSEPLSPPPRA